MEKKKIDYNSPVNQDIKQKLVAREVIHRCNIMIDELSKANIQDSWTSGEIYNLKDEIVGKFFSVYDENSEYYEPLEFWIITDWLGEKLKEHGELVDELFDFTIWARRTSGQAIALDYVISRIAEEMEILDGQQYSWSNRT